MPGNDAQPTTDISQEAHSLARMADRLPYGETFITIIKMPKPDAWTIKVARVVQTKETGK